MKTMVKAILCNVLFFVVCYMGNAQSDSGKRNKSGKSEQTATTANSDKAKKSKSHSKNSKYSFMNNGDYVMMADGKVYRKMNGKIHIVTSVEYLPKALKIMPDGILEKPDGSRVELTNGEVVNENGDLVKGDANWLLNEKIVIARGDFKDLENRNRELEDKLTLMNERIKQMSNIHFLLISFNSFGLCFHHAFLQFLGHFIYIH